MPTTDGPKPPQVHTPLGVPLSAVIDHFGLEVVADGGRDLSARLVNHARPNRPGRTWSDLAGHLPSGRLLVVGAEEWEAFHALGEAERATRTRRFVELDVPAIILARGLPVGSDFVGTLAAGGIPLLRTASATGDFAGDLIWFLQLELAPRAVMHAGLVDVAGEGVLILGRSGIGKSETALELIRRGHRLIADDTVEVRRPTEHELIGRAPGRMRHFMEVKGIGIVNLRHIYGIGAVKSSGDVEMAVYLVPDDESYDGQGSDRMDVLGVDLPLFTIPMRPGRNAAVLIEAAATTLRARVLADLDSVHQTHFEHRAETFGRLR